VGWICSVAAVKAETTETMSGSLMRHFFLPSDWLSNNNELLIEVTKQGDIICVKRDEVAVVKRGLSNIEPGPWKPLIRDTSLLDASRSS
jgi:hypothetical protein